jgi:hypothetical protein
MRRVTTTVAARPGRFKHESHERRNHLHSMRTYVGARHFEAGRQGSALPRVPAQGGSGENGGEPCKSGSIRRAAAHGSAVAGHSRAAGPETARAHRRETVGSWGATVARARSEEAAGPRCDTRRGCVSGGSRAAPGPVATRDTACIGTWRATSIRARSTTPVGARHGACGAFASVCSGPPRCRPCARSEGARAPRG